MSLHTIDIFLSVIDNYGDVGFATELLLSFKKEYKGKYHFRLFTDNTALLSNFLEKNSDFLPSYEILSLTNPITKKLSPIVFLLFHFPIPTICDDDRHIILRIDYLSFDRKWVKNTGKEHVLSTSHIPIIEIIPSLLPVSAGCIFPSLSGAISRTSFLEKFHLPQELETKKWISMFVYKETFERINFSHSTDDIVIFLLGGGENIHHPQIFSLPFLSVNDYHALLSLSDMNLVRGEVSAVAAMIIKKPFLWDMYKVRGGFPHEMSDQFLSFFQFSEKYRALHLEYNLSQNQIDIEEITYILRKEPYFLEEDNQLGISPLVETLEKYIDRFYFSL